MSNSYIFDPIFDSSLILQLICFLIFLLRTRVFITHLSPRNIIELTMVLFASSSPIPFGEYLRTHVIFKGDNVSSRMMFNYFYHVTSRQWIVLYIDEDEPPYLKKKNLLHNFEKMVGYQVCNLIWQDSMGLTEAWSH